MMAMMLFAAAVVASAPTPPNILLIVADDLGWGDLGCYGNEIINTPHLDALADRGVRMTDFYAGAPMCSPSRTALLTGRQAQRAGIYDWIPPGSYLNLRANHRAFPELLKRQGMQTALSGKWHLNGGMELGQTDPSHFGFDDWFAVQFNDQHLNPEGFFRNGKPVDVEGYSCQIVADDAIDWLHNRRTARQPFFQMVTFQEPHEVVMSPPRLADKYSEYEGTKPLYYSNVEHLDEATGRIIDALDELKLSDNTLVIFTSDHGPAQHTPNGYFRNSHGSTGPFRGYKRWLLEGGLRVPGIFVWPGQIPAGKTSSTPPDSVTSSLLWSDWPEAGCRIT